MGIYLVDCVRQIDYLIRADDHGDGEDDLQDCQPAEESLELEAVAACRFILNDLVSQGLTLGDMSAGSAQSHSSLLLDNNIVH